MTTLAAIGGFAMEHPLLTLAAWFLLFGWACDAFEREWGLTP